MTEFSPSLFESDNLSAVRFLSREGASLYPFASRWLRLPGGRFHYLDERPTSPGEAKQETLLFVHGNPTWSFHWRGLIASLSNERRCVAIDHLGCGLSDLSARPLELADHVENLVKVIEELDLTRVTLVAQDWGGAIGLATLLKQSDRFDRIVLFNTGAFPPRRIPRRINLCRTTLVGQLAVQGLNLFSRAALKMTTTRRRLDRSVAAGYLAPYASWKRRQAVYQFVKDIPASTAHPTWSTLEELEYGLASLASLPILLVWGMRDWCFTPDCLERFLTVWPDAQSHRLHDVGHWVVEDAPEDALRLVQAFLQGTQSGTAIGSASGAVR